MTLIDDTVLLAFTQIYFIKRLFTLAYQLQKIDTSKLLNISSALSDERRIRILEALLPGKPLKYTEIMKQLGRDVVEDSSKFAYHMDVLCEANAQSED